MNSRVGLALLVWIVILAVDGFSQSADATAGREAFERSCVRCHLPSGEPNEAIEQVLGVEMRHLGSEEVQSKTDMELDRNIGEGNGRMLPIRNLTAEDRQNLIAYLRSLSQE